MLTRCDSETGFAVVVVVVVVINDAGETGKGQQIVLKLLLQIVGVSRLSVNAFNFSGH